MKKCVKNEESFIFQYILLPFGQDKHIFINELCTQFKYYRISIYKILVKINDNWTVMNHPYKLEKLNANEYRRVLIK